MPSLLRPVLTLVLLGFVAGGCGSSQGSEVNGGKGTGNGSNASGDGVNLNPGANNGPGTVISPSDACATGTANASLSGVNMFVMFDRSTSMNDRANAGGATRWALTSAALTAFFQSPDAAGLKLALRFFPHDQPAPGCNRDGCDVAACAAPLVNLGTLTADPAPADQYEQALVTATAMSAPVRQSQGTPIYAALAGALQWAHAERQKTPTENSVVVLVTDGEANGCEQDINQIAQLAADALATDGVRTYAIGLTGSRDQDMNQIAMAGGTTKGIFVQDGSNTQQDLLDALGAIRGQVLDCDFPMPAPKPGLELDPQEINVNFTAGSGTKSTLPQVADDAACSGGQGWYYDNPLDPSRIILCKSSCDTVTADAMASLEILLGCQTVTTTPK